MPNLETIKELIDYIVLQGLAIVAGSVFVMICLWAFYQLMAGFIGILAALREWVPKWLASQTELNEAYKTSVITSTESLRDIKAAVLTTQLGVVRLLEIANKDA